jgi:DNA-binding transcriptional LysR family regulator
MYDYCKIVVKEYDEMVGLFNSIKIDNKVIRIGATSLIYSDKLVSIFLEFHDHYPNIKLEFIALGYYDCERYLKNDCIDFCLTIKPDDIVNYRFIPIWRDRFLLYMSKNNHLCRKKQINMSDLKNERFVMLSRDTKASAIVRDYINKAGYDPEVIMSTSQMSLAFEYITRNKAIAILPEYVIPKSFRNRDEVFTTYIEDLSCSFEMGIIYYKNKQLSQEELSIIKYMTAFLKTGMNIIDEVNI